MIAGLGPAAAWICAGLLLAMAELSAPGVFLIWIGIAAIVTGALTLASGVGVAAQLGLFAAATLACVQLARLWVARGPEPDGDPLLNDRVGRLIGRRVRVTEAVDADGGRVAVEDGAWPARGVPAPVGAWVRVVDHADGRLLVVAEDGPVPPDAG